MVTATISIVVVTALAAVAAGVIIATGGKDLVKQLLEDAAGVTISDAELDAAARFVGYTSADDFVSSFTTRGYLLAGAGVALLIFGVLAGKAATWARVMVTISSVGVMLFSVVVMGDETTDAMFGLALLAFLGAILSIIFIWLPANGRYGKALRAQA